MTDKSKIHFVLDADPNRYPPVTEESLWGQEIGDGSYRILNIPMFAEGISLHDVVSVNEINKKLMASKVISRGGHSTLRVSYVVGMDISPVLAGISALRCTLEHDERNGIVGIDVPPDVSYDDVADLLESFQYMRDQIVIEDTCTQHK